MIRSGWASAPPRRRKRRATRGILSGPVGHRSGSSRRLPSREDAPLRASQPRGAASPRGVHGSGPSAGARGARAGGGAAARAQGRCLSPTSELSSGRPRSLAGALALLSRSTPAPAARRSARGPVGAHPRPEPARRPRAPGSRPRRHLPEPEATSSSSQTLRPVSCPAGPAGGSPSPARPVCGARRGRGRGRGRAAANSRPLPGRHPSPPRGWRSRGRGGGRGRAEPGPTSAPARAPPPRALTPQALPRRSDRLRPSAWPRVSTRLCWPLWG